MDLSDRPPVPERTSTTNRTLPQKYAPLMPAAPRENLQTKYFRVVSAKSAVSNLSMESRVSEFLESKVELLQAEVDYLHDYQHGLRLAVASEKLALGSYREEMERLDNTYLPVLDELKTIKKQRKTLEGDMEDDLELPIDPDDDTKRSKLDPEPNVDFMERAYASTMVARIMSATANQKQRRFDQSKFKKDVAAYLHAHDPDDPDTLWCHLTGWKYQGVVKAARLVPKALKGDELAHLFGVDEIVLSNPKNGITLLGNIEEGLDLGIIVIVPKPPTDAREKTKWMCVVIDEKMKNKTYITLERPAKWMELHLKQLEFRSNNRPARRYLYFRFVITYLWAKREGNMEWVEAVEARKVFWASPGPYLEKSTLKALGRNISGVELPPSLYENETFESNAPPTINDDALLAGRLRDAMTSMAKRARGGDEDNEEEEDTDDESSDEL